MRLHGYSTVLYIKVHCKASILRYEILDGPGAKLPEKFFTILGTKIIFWTAKNGGSRKGGRGVKFFVIGKFILS